MFQPAEETGQGADAVVKDNRFAALAPDVVFALHNLPGYDQGAVLVKAGVMNCASAGMKVRWKGQAAHASQPENSISPAQPIASLIRQWPQLAEAPVVADQGALVTIVHATLGEPSFGIIPGTGQLWATLRCESDAGLEQLVETSRHLVDTSTKHLDLEVQVTVHDHFIATQNDPLATMAVFKAAENLGMDNA